MLLAEQYHSGHFSIVLRYSGRGSLAHPGWCVIRRVGKWRQGQRGHQCQPPGSDLAHLIVRPWCHLPEGQYMLIGLVYQVKYLLERWIVLRRKQNGAFIAEDQFSRVEQFSLCRIDTRL